MFLRPGLLLAALLIVHPLPGRQHFARPAFAAEAPQLDPLLAFYTGSFDPPTKAHLTIIRNIVERGARKVIVMVNQTGEKNFKASSEERMEMLRAALADLGDKVEIRAVAQEDKNAVIRSLAKREASYYTFVGDDSFEKLQQGAFSGKERWMVVTRDGLSAEGKALAAQVGAQPFHVELPEGASSTQLRTDLAQGKLDSPLLDPAVNNYIQEQGLYRALPPEIEKAQGAIFRDAFRDFLRQLKAAAPDLDLEGIPDPAFDPLQSRKAWAERFQNWVQDKKKFSGSTREAFRENAGRILYVKNENGTFPRLPRLEAEPDLPDSPASAPRISRIQRHKPPPLPTDSTLNLQSYVNQRVPEPVQKLLQENRGAIYLHDGSVDESLAHHAQEGFTQRYLMRISMGNPNTRNYLLRNPQTGEVRLVLGSLGTEDRVAQLRGQVEIFAGNLPIYRVHHEEPVLPFAFNKLGDSLTFTEKDKVVMGFRNVVASHYAKNKDWEAQLISEGGIDITMYTNRKTGERVINPRNVYGDEMKPLIDAFYRKGIRDFTLLGTAGGVDPRLKIGDVVVPSSLSVDGAPPFRFPNSAGEVVKEAVPASRTHLGTQHGWVQTILKETKSHVAHLQNGGVQSIDIEGRYLAEFLRDHPDMKGGLALFISDLPLSKENYEVANGNLPKVQDSVRRTLDGFFQGASTGSASKAIPCSVDFSRLTTTSAQQP